MQFGRHVLAWVGNDKGLGEGDRQERGRRELMQKSCFTVTVTVRLAGNALLSAFLICQAHEHIVETGCFCRDRDRDLKPFHNPRAPCQVAFETGN